MISNAKKHFLCYSRSRFVRRQAQEKTGEPNSSSHSCVMPCDNVKQQIPVTLALHTTTSHLDRDGGRAIHPKHIREAMRRYQYDMGPTAPLTVSVADLTGCWYCMVAPNNAHLTEEARVVVNGGSTVQS